MDDAKESVLNVRTKEASDSFFSSISNIIALPFTILGSMPSPLELRDPLVFTIIKYIFIFASIVGLVVFLITTNEDSSFTKDNILFYMGPFLVLLLLNLVLIFTNTPSTNFLYNTYALAFAFLFLALTIYFYTTNNQLGNKIFSYMSGFGLFLILICFLAIMFYFTGKYLQRMEGLAGFLVQFIFYIPCLLIKFVEYMKKQLDETTNTVFFLYVLLVLGIIIYIYLPQITQFFLLGGAKIVGAQEDTFNGFNLFITMIASFFLIVMAGFNSMFSGIAMFFTMIAGHLVGAQEETFNGFNLFITALLAFFISGAASATGFFTSMGLNMSAGLASMAVFCALIIPYLVGLMVDGFNGFTLLLSIIAGGFLAGIATLGGFFTAIAILGVLVIGYFAALKDDAFNGFNLLLPIILAFILAGVAGTGSFFSGMGANVAGLGSSGGAEGADGASASGGIFERLKNFGLLQYGITLLIVFGLVLIYFFFPQLTQYFATRNAVVLQPKSTFLTTENVVAGSNEWMQRDTSGKRQYNQNFALSCWIYLNSQPSNYTSYAEETTILEFAEGAPKITYEYVKNENDENDKLNIYFTNHEEYYNEAITLPIKKQKWNNLVFNYNSQYADVFLNGKLERTLNLSNKPPQFDDSQFLVTGANNGLDGAISNITYYPYPLTKTEVVALYNIYSIRNPPDYIQ